VERADWAGRYEKNPVAGRQLRPSDDSPSLGTLRAHPAMLRRLRPIDLARAATKTMHLRAEHRHYVKLTRTARGRELASLDDEVFRQLVRDDDFYRQFDDSGPEP
jgi:hypothetical protein